MEPDVLILSNFYGSDVRNAEAMREVLDRVPEGTAAVLFSATPWLREPPRNVWLKTFGTPRRANRVGHLTTRFVESRAGEVGRMLDGLVPAQ